MFQRGWKNWKCHKIVEYYIDLKQYFKSVFVTWNEEGIIVGSILGKQMIFRTENKGLLMKRQMILCDMNTMTMMGEPSCFNRAGHRLVLSCFVTSYPCILSIYIASCLDHIKHLSNSHLVLGDVQMEKCIETMKKEETVLLCRVESF